MINRQDVLIFKALRKAYINGIVEISMDMNILNTYGSLFYNPWNNIIPLVTPSLIGLIIMVAYNMFYGLLLIIVGFITHRFYVKIAVEKIVRDKVISVMFNSVGSFQYVWSLGALTLYMKSNHLVGCKSKDDNLKSFVSLNLSDYMLDKKEDADLKMPLPPPNLEEMIKEVLKQSKEQEVPSIKSVQSKRQLSPVNRRKKQEIIEDEFDDDDDEEYNFDN